MKQKVYKNTVQIDLGLFPSQNHPQIEPTYTYFYGFAISFLPLFNPKAWEISCNKPSTMVGISKWNMIQYANKSCLLFGIGKE